MESKPCLYISGCVEAALEQFFNSRLRCGAPQRSDKRVPFQRDLCVGRSIAIEFCRGRLRDIRFSISIV